MFDLTEVEIPDILSNYVTLETYLSHINQHSIEEITSFILENLKNDTESVFRLLLYFSLIRSTYITEIVEIWSIISKETNTSFSIIPLTLENVYLADVLYHKGLIPQDQIKFNVPYEFIDFKTYVGTYKKPPFKKALKLSTLLNIYPENSVLSIIRKDDVESLQNLTVDPEFSLYMTVKPLVYDGYRETEEMTLLSASAFYGSLKCFKYILMNTDNFVAPEVCKFAVSGGNFEIIHISRQNGRTFNNTLSTAIKYHRNDVASWLIQNCQESGDFELNDAIQALNTTATLYAMKNGSKSKIGEFFHTESISVSAERGYYPVFRALIECGARATVSYGFGPLHGACMSGGIMIVKYLVEEQNIDVNKNETGRDFPPLHIACHGGVLDVVRYLIGKGANVNSRNSYNNVPLFYACYYGRYDCAKELLDHGSEIPESVTRVPMTEYLVQLLDKYSAKKDP